MELMLLTYDFLSGVVIYDTTVFDSEGEGILSRTIEEVRQSRHKTVQYHSVDAQSDPSRPVSSASVVTQHDGDEQLADVVTHCDYS